MEQTETEILEIVSYKARRAASVSAQHKIQQIIRDIQLDQEFEKYSVYAASIILPIFVLTGLYFLR